MKHILITIVMAAMLVTSANAQTITPTGMSQGDLVALLQNVVNALGSSVGSTYITQTAALSPVFSSGTFTMQRFVASDVAVNQVFQKSRSATLGTNTIVVNGDSLGDIYFEGANGGTGYDDAARISAFVDGNPGATNDMPGRLQFYTSADGSGTPAIRQIINNAGNVTIGATDLASTTARLHVGGVTRIAGTVAAAAITNPVLQLQYYDEAADPGLTMTLPTAPPAGHVNVFAIKTGAGVYSIRFQMPDNSTEEVALVP